MKREGSLEEISDGRLYGPDDLVKADCGGCEGCSACCHNMGDTVVLDPFDFDRISRHLGRTPEDLLNSKIIDLHVEEGMILPHLPTVGSENACVFLNEEGRCGIHIARPGICRLFPLGRYYEGNSFRYFLQIHECRKKSRAKIKVKKWLDTPDLAEYEKYVRSWHGFVSEVKIKVRSMQDSAEMRKMNLAVLQLFYLKPYSGADNFYQQFYSRLQHFRQETWKETEM
ncbi:YkgJ family cysteine cluster protein [Cuneatibacter caecimuris]|uniref:YkgJ family cysteine cluster protein n=1 Tax=Cuneatibacter caecimuris TaxID=1796618 RepID=A0A4Q7PL73_9FIRM|nr:YkgJ family cysteine cluster protein [Cuneatibacter caecimuris]RZT00868.1 hypothetical protein EV209_1302 [Cuneatibacter caecimuris]